VELYDIALILLLQFVMIIVLLRLLVAVMKRLIPQMVPELMGQVKDNIPKISPKQAVGWALYQFVNQGGIQFLMSKFLGMEMPGPGQEMTLGPGQVREVKNE
jgi:hypothetical protein